MQQSARNRAARRQLLEARNEKIREEFKKYWDKGYRAEYIYDELKKSYYLDESTLEAIIFRRGAYKV